MPQIIPRYLSIIGFSVNEQLRKDWKNLGICARIAIAGLLRCRIHLSAPRVGIVV